MIRIRSCKYNLKFKFDAGTSRGVMKDRDVWYVMISDPERNITGWGECAPLKGLSLDFSPEFQVLLDKFCKNAEALLNEKKKAGEVLSQIPVVFPSIKTGIETALLDYTHGGRRQIFENGFYDGEIKLPVNGLVWMGNIDFMQHQVENKLSEGYSCIKIKIGAIDFESEIELIRKIRNKYNPDEIIIRTDANGAFSPEEVYSKLDKLFKLGIHSIEQPLKAEYKDQLAELCVNSPIPIALDESLIGQSDSKEKLLDYIKPAYIIIKPTLLGGFAESADWIDLAERKKIGWWITSALESNIGLNAVCQFTAQYPVNTTQGLGTGNLYHNNINSPLSAGGGTIQYSKNKRWDLDPIAILFDS